MKFKTRLRKQREREFSPLGDWVCENDRSLRVDSLLERNSGRKGTLAPSPRTSFLLLISLSLKEKRLKSRDASMEKSSFYRHSHS